ncbi:hypothetical protein PpBr36_02740 [Pyricularia pennisetigena]|uniref:hypothetical protein n=1 Tax=Pyricularia pennisetigena TaxID=1578925 RepID=UPI0011509356|nr:hypothetical protein PpBr36_02740 [Pyricularia pennisetigena]TLS31571.1 hypothetical protein PpBr36_02740 [Pyricularia pennisetigena]
MLFQLRPWRLVSALPIVLVLLVAGFVLTRLVGFLHIFGVLQPHSGVRITQGEIELEHNRGRDPSDKPVVPRITHQIFHAWKHPGNDTLPDHWAHARESCRLHNPDWEHKIWYTENSREFLRDNYPWFLPTYDGYKFPIQRIDVLRYFLLRHYGGIYLDLDNGCAASLDALTYYPAFTTDGGHGALSNNIMGGQPGHPFFHLLTENLPAWDWNWLLPYVIISYCSGQWFVTAMWERYHQLLQLTPGSGGGSVSGLESLGRGWRPLHHVLMDMREGADPWVYFTQVRGGTWSNWDSDIFPWIGDHIPEIAGAVALTSGLVAWFCVWMVRRRRTRDRGKGYLPLAVEEHALASRS